jgi:hypothetical protein
MIDYSKSPPVSDALIRFLEDSLSTDHVLTEASREGLTGLEQLGFLKGARHALNILKTTQRIQEEETY